MWTSAPCDTGTAYRRSPVGAQNQWRAVKAMLLSDERKQRFSPPPPERALCKRFGTPEGCPFKDDCTHFHSLDGINDIRDVERPEIKADAPGVFLHKMEDRKVGKGSISLILRTLATGGFVQVDGPEAADLILTNAFPPPSLLSKLRPGCFVNHFPGEQELSCIFLVSFLTSSVILPLPPKGGKMAELRLKDSKKR